MAEPQSPRSPRGAISPPTSPRHTVVPLQKTVKYNSNINPLGTVATYHSVATPKHQAPLFKCAKCGSAMTSNSANCNSCGEVNPNYGAEDVPIHITIPKAESTAPTGPTIRCSACEKPFPATAKFCQSCGHAAPNSPVSSLVKCRKCGSSFPSNSTFCFACGDSDAANRLPISSRGARPLNLPGHSGNADPSPSSPRSGAPRGNDGSAKPPKDNSAKASHDPSSGHGGAKPKDLDFKKFDEKFAKLQKKAPNLDDLVLARRLNKVILLLNDVTAAYNSAPSDESNSKELTKRMDAVQKFSDDIDWDAQKKKRKPTSTPSGGSISSTGSANKTGSGATKIPVQAESTVTFTHVPDAHSNPSGSTSGAAGKDLGGSGASQGAGGTTMDFDEEFKKFDAKFAKLRKNVDDYDDLELSPKINKLVHRLNKITDEFNAIKHDGSRDVIREHMKNELNRRQDDLGAWSGAIDWVKHEKKRKPESSSGSAKKAGTGPNTNNTGKSATTTASPTTGGGFVETQAYKDAIRVFLEIYARYNNLTKQQVWSGQSDQIVRDWDNWCRIHHPALTDALKNPGAHTAELEKVVRKYNAFAGDLTKKLDLFDVTQEQRNFLDNFENEHNRLYEKFRDNLHNLAELERTSGDLATLKTDLLLNAFGLAEHPRYIKSMEVTSESLANMKEVITQLKNDPNTKVSFGHSRGKARDPVVHNTVVATTSSAPPSASKNVSTTVTTTKTSERVTCPHCQTLILRTRFCESCGGKVY